MGDEEKDLCEGSITDTEIKNVLKNMQKGRTPGTDGFPAEFYKFVWNYIGKYVINSLNDAYK